MSETIDWARTLVLLHASELEPGIVRRTLNVLLKFQDDIQLADAELTGLLAVSRKSPHAR